MWKTWGFVFISECETLLLFIGWIVPMELFNSTEDKVQRNQLDAAEFLCVY